MIVLTVINPFGDYQKGDQITDQKAIDAILASENQGHVVKTNAPDPKAPPPASA